MQSIVIRQRNHSLWLHHLSPDTWRSRCQTLSFPGYASELTRLWTHCGSGIDWPQQKCNTRKKNVTQCLRSKRMIKLTVTKAQSRFVVVLQERQLFTFSASLRSVFLFFLFLWRFMGTLVRLGIPSLFCFQEKKSLPHRDLVKSVGLLRAVALLPTTFWCEFSFSLSAKMARTRIKTDLTSGEKHVKRRGYICETRNHQKQDFLIEMAN